MTGNRQQYYLTIIVVETHIEIHTSTLYIGISMVAITMRDYMYK